MKKGTWLLLAILALCAVVAPAVVAEGAPGGATIDIQPKSVSEVTESRVTFSLHAVNADSYKWEYTSLPETAAEPYWIDASSNTSVSGSDTPSLTVVTTGNNSARRYRCAVMGADGQIVYSDEVSFTVAGRGIQAKTLRRAGISAAVGLAIVLAWDMSRRKARRDDDGAA